MGTTYEVNKFNQVVPYDCGRMANDTRLYRDLTEFEEQLLEQIKELEKENNELKNTVAIPHGRVVKPTLAEDTIHFKDALHGKHIIDLIVKRLADKNIRCYDSAIVNELRKLDFTSEY